jgi:hypothetical protein
MGGMVPGAMGGAMGGKNNLFNTPPYTYLIVCICNCIYV